MQEVKNDSPDRMGTVRIGKLLLEFSLPAILGCIFNSLYNIIDTVILGYAVGNDGIAVTTLALPVMMLTMGCSMLAGVGGNALAALQMGEGKRDEVERTLGNTTVLLFAFSAIAGFIGIVFIDQVLALVGTTELLWGQAKTFIQIICVGCAFQSVGFGLNNFLRTAGKPMLSFGANILGTIMCVILNVVFVIVLDFGVAGSALATVMGQGFSAIPVIWYLTAVKDAPFHLRISKFKPDVRLMGKIMSLGLASFVMQCASTLVNGILNHVVGIWGALDPIGIENGLAALGVAGKAGMFACMPIIGLTQGAQPLIGYNYGAKNWDRVIKTSKWAITWCFSIGVVMWILLHLFDTQIVQIFNVSADVQAFAADALVLYSILMPLVGAQIMMGSYFQSSGQPFKAGLLELIRQVGFLIPLYLTAPPLLCSIFGGTPLMGVIYCSPVSDLLATTVTACFFIAELRRLFKWRAEAKVAKPEPQAA